MAISLVDHAVQHLVLADFTAWPDDWRLQIDWDTQPYSQGNGISPFWVVSPEHISLFRIIDDSTMFGERTGVPSDRKVVLVAIPGVRVSRDSTEELHFDGDFLYLDSEKISLADEFKWSRPIIVAFDNGEVHSIETSSELIVTIRDSGSAFHSR